MVYYVIDVYYTAIYSVFWHINTAFRIFFNPVNIIAGEFRIASGKLPPAIMVKRRRYFWDAEFYPRRVVNRRR